MSDAPAKRQCNGSRENGTSKGAVVDGYLVRPQPVPAMVRDVGKTALSVVGGCVPVTPQEFGRRAYAHALDPLANPLKQVMESADSVYNMPPMLGIFSDIPMHKLREDEVMAWARAGFTWVVTDGEHSQTYGRGGREHNAMLLRAGITPVQRLHREAVSEHGDALASGARATMRPYGSTVEEAEQYYRAVSYPKGDGSATADDRGGFPMRLGDRQMTFTPASLRAAESETQGWIQFETGEYILDTQMRDKVLDIMKAQGPHKAAGFIGPFDAIIRNGPTPTMENGINSLIEAAAARGIPMGRVVGSGSLTDPKGIEDAMVVALEKGARLICAHYMTSDLPYIGAVHAATPFFNACARVGLNPESSKL